ncbi:hypothetical protein EJ05DRAFT_498265 [Pseudovirgaria hyperparasitica]|uniref:Uncharacterized protein n=1 Tax=Pseudovirgaria hyperparasitica TaxID=470096 RepID=A0A6A6WGM2_9PEZI|nr:uncharacterized protein EJ05DRAFT_498265 [Pseudovirgaria hyperparasitica]KAF2760301.1 hypothetical protein EJ05DRAFT_498265 [Pseudovirgaria hyperparasitica]
MKTGAFVASFALLASSVIALPTFKQADLGSIIAALDQVSPADAAAVQHGAGATNSKRQADITSFLTALLPEGTDDLPVPGAHGNSKRQLDQLLSGLGGLGGQGNGGAGGIGDIGQLLSGLVGGNSGGAGGLGELLKGLGGGNGDAAGGLTQLLSGLGGGNGEGAGGLSQLLSGLGGAGGLGELLKGIGGGAVGGGKDEGAGTGYQAEKI